MTPPPDQEPDDLKLAVHRLTDIAESNRDDIKDIVKMLKGDGSIGGGWAGEISALKLKVSILWKVAAVIGTISVSQAVYILWEVITK